MAGRSRTVDTGRTRGNRRARQHRPAGETESAHRDRVHRGARALVNQRIDRARDPLRQLDIARDYVRSAAQKYQVRGETAPAIEALLAAGDELYRTGSPKSRTRR